MGKIIRTHPAGVSITRERHLPNVNKIVINPKEILVLHGQGKETFRRKDWRLYVDDIMQAQDEEVWSNEIWDEKRHRIVSGYVQRTLFIMEGTEFDQPTSCRIVEDEKIIFCGRNPVKMGYL